MILRLGREFRTFSNFHPSEKVLLAVGDAGVKIDDPAIDCDWFVEGTISLGGAAMEGVEEEGGIRNVELVRGNRTMG